MIFKDYLNNIKYLKDTRMEGGQYLDTLNKAIYVPETRYLSEGKEIIYKKDLVSSEFNFGQLINLFGTPPKMIVNSKIGEHPDFCHLSSNEKEYHYAVSMFLDIKGSTALARKYGFDLEKVRLLKDTILTLSIYICNFFGGHIQRLQGDGIFVYFVNKNEDPKDASVSALNASSMINYFVRHELSTVFEEIDVDPLQIRTGIDYGRMDEVLWSRYGIPGCNELTTTSPHTDFAAKLQGQAGANGIMIGDNVKNVLDLNDKLVTYEGQLYGYYKYHEFKWENYFSTFDFISRKQGKGLEKIDADFNLECFINDANGNIIKYHQNLYSLPKDLEMSFRIMRNGVEYSPTSSDEIEWTIYNSGKEADADGSLVLGQGRVKHSGSLNDIKSKYLGHHYVECKLKRFGNTEKILKFYTFVQ